MAAAEQWRDELDGEELLSVETKYFEWMPGVDPTRESAHMKQLLPILAEEWPEEISGS
jgi:hypothetical protein